MAFNFTLDDLVDFSDDGSDLPSSGALQAVLREQGTPFKTSASGFGYANQQVSITNMSSLMLGVPMYKDSSVSVSQQEFALSNLLGSSLDSSVNEDAKVGYGFDELVPSNIRKEADAYNGSSGSGSSSADTPIADKGDVPAMNAEQSDKGFIWPIQPPVQPGSGFGYRIHPISGVRKLHKGIDIPVPKGTAVHAAKAGTVSRLAEGGGSTGAGWYIRLTHDDGCYTNYFHLSKYVAAEGAKVPQGALIAESGGDGSPGSGSSTGAHLHFEIRFNGEATDPIPYLPAIK